MGHLHATFTAYAYSFAGFVFLGLSLWLALDHRAEQKKLTELETRRAKKK